MIHPHQCNAIAYLAKKLNIEMAFAFLNIMLVLYVCVCVFYI